MVTLSDLVSYTDELLGSAGFDDYCPNGLQVEGRSEVARLVSGVTASAALLDAALAAGADAVLVHHGYFWRGESPRVTGIKRQRLQRLLANEVSLLAYHLPLDRHPELGNNALAARALGMERLTPFGELGGELWGVRGLFPEPVPVAELSRRVGELYGGEPLHFAHGPDPVASAGIVSGGAQRALQQAIDAGLDLFLTGEASEWVMNLAREAGIHFVAAGHYATERLGVRALGDHLADHFGIEVEFVDIPNPV